MVRADVEEAMEAIAGEGQERLRGERISSFARPSRFRSRLQFCSQWHNLATGSTAGGRIRVELRGRGKGSITPHGHYSAGHGLIPDLRLSDQVLAEIDTAHRAHPMPY